MICRKCGEEKWAFDFKFSIKKGYDQICKSCVNKGKRISERQILRRSDLKSPFRFNASIKGSSEP